MLAFAVLSALGLEVCGSCTVTGRDVRLCEPHAVAEGGAFEREARNLASAEESQRLAALDALSKLTYAHENAPSERVASRIAAALDDDSFAVRKRAAELLDRPQHALKSLAALADALADSARDIERLEKEHEKWRRAMDGDPSPKQREKLQAELGARNERRKLLFEWRLQVTRRLASFPDDRAVDALCEHTPRDLLAADLELARLGTRRALEAAILGVKHGEEAIALARANVESKRAIMGEGELLKGFEDFARGIEEEVAAFRNDLVTLLSQRGLSPPLGKDGTYDNWKKWLEKQRDALPEHLPGVSSPAW